MAPVSHAKMLDWLLPVLLTAVLGVLAWMGQNISDMSRYLAVAVSKIDDHERRLGNIEGVIFRRDHR